MDTSHARNESSIRTDVESSTTICVVCRTRLHVPRDSHFPKYIVEIQFIRRRCLSPVDVYNSRHKPRDPHRSYLSGNTISPPSVEHQDNPEFTFTGDVKQRLRDLFVWTVTLPNTFRSRVEEYDPGILKLLAWSNAAMRELYLVEKDIWWIEKMAQYGVQDVLRFL
jgi:hypothetical protein